MNKTPLSRTKFDVNMIYHTVSSDAKSKKDSNFGSFTQFVKEALIVDPSKGSFPNIYPYLTNRSSSDSVDILLHQDSSVPSLNKIVFSPGHCFPMDPGAVASFLGRTFTETESITHFFDHLILQAHNVPKLFSFDVLPWNDLKNTIKLVNNLDAVRSKLKKPSFTHIAVHSDYAISNVELRPLTFGIYYGSQSGLKLAKSITSNFMKNAEALYPGRKFTTWVRPESDSPHGSLGIISSVTPISLLFEVDFVSRPKIDLDLIYTCLSKTILNDTASSLI